MLSAIAKPFGILLMWLYTLTNSYGLAVILFALIVKIILLPFQMKAKRSSIKMMALQAEQQEIEKRHGANRQKYNEELQKLYQREGVKPMSGCLWSLIPFPILIALYQAIRYPLTIMMGVSADLLAEGGAIAEMLTQRGFTATMNAAYVQIEQSQFISNAANWTYFQGLSDKLRQINYNFLGLDLGAKPQLSAIWNGGTAAEILLLLIPVVAAVLTYLQSKISMKLTQSDNNPQQRSMGAMNILMPLMTLYFAYIMPAALGVYWIAGSVFAIIQEIILNKKYAKEIEETNREVNERMKQREAELEAKRAETERLKKENATVRNENTSKKKIQSSEKQKQQKRADEWRAKKAGEPEEDNPSAVGDRRYARGRAYDPDRYTRMGEPSSDETAAEETAAEETASKLVSAAKAEAETVAADAAAIDAIAAQKVAEAADAAASEIDDDEEAEDEPEYEEDDADDEDIEDVEEEEDTDE